MSAPSLEEVQADISALEDVLGIPRSKGAKLPLTPRSVSTRAPSRISRGSSCGSLPSGQAQRQRPTSAPSRRRSRMLPVDIRQNELVAVRARARPSSAGQSRLVAGQSQSAADSYASHPLSRTQSSFGRVPSAARARPNFSGGSLTRSRCEHARATGKLQSQDSKPLWMSASTEECSLHFPMSSVAAGGLLLPGESRTWDSSGIKEAMSRFVPRLPSSHRLPDPQLSVPAGGWSTPERVGNGKASRLLQVASLTGPLLFVR